MAYVPGDSLDNTLVGTEDDDVLDASYGDDSLTGGLGNDTLYGSRGDDTYVFNVGDGSDRIFEYDDYAYNYGSNEDTDTIVFGAGIDPADVTFSDVGGDLLITIGSNGDTILVNNFLDVLGAQIEQFQFDDGTVLSVGDVVTILMTGTDDDDYIYGTSGDDTISGLGGDDEISGGRGDDDLTGGAGDDEFYSSRGSDTYHFNVGDGSDYIYEYDYNAYYYGANEDTDTIVFGAGIDPEDVTFSNGGSGDLLVTIGTNGDSIRINNFLHELSAQIEHFQFDNGTVLDVGDVMTFLLTGTEGNDTIYGTSDDDTISGLGGDDEIHAENGDDDLTGGTGDDVLYGEAGSDTYHFNIGDGADYIHEYDDGYASNGVNADVDMIALGAGIVPADISIELDADGSLVISIIGSDDSITVDNYFWNEERIEQIQFADGTLWDAAEIEARANNETEGDDRLVGGRGNDTFTGLGGDDAISGGDGNDHLSGGAGSDWLSGGEGSDTYTFNLGDGSDLVYDYDYYAYEYGVNQDADVLILGAGIDPDDVTVRRDGSGGFYLYINDDDTVQLANFEDGLENQIEEIRFNDGTIWHPADLIAKANVATDDDDVLIGSDDSDTLSGLGGDDYIEGNRNEDVLDGGDDNDEIDGGQGDDHITGGTGNDDLLGSVGSDTYHFNLGDGADIIREYDYYAYEYGYNVDTDVVVFGAGIDEDDVKVTRNADGDLILTIVGTSDSITIENFMEELSNQIEQVHFASGAIWTVDDLTLKTNHPTEFDDDIRGTSSDNSLYGLGGADEIFGAQGNDTLNGGKGDDYLEGDDGSDTYLFNLGDGDDTIYDYDYGDDYGGVVDTDVISFGAGIGPDDVIVRANRNGDLVLTIADTNDSITVEDAARAEGNRIEEIHFAGGQVWTSAQILAAAMAGTASDDNIFAASTGSTISGLGGDDWIVGDDGNDALAGGTGDDQIFADDGNDTLTGGEGDDYLEGEDGSDTYVFNLGDGSDTIYDYEYSSYGPEGTDTILLGADIDPSDLTVRATVYGDLIISINGTSDEIRIEGFFNGAAIEQLKFHDNTIWDVNTLTAAANLATEGNDYLEGTSAGETINALGGNDFIYGFGGNDTLVGGTGTDLIDGDDGSDLITGGKGDDTLDGGEGSDTYHFSLGDGDDRIRDYDYEDYEYGTPNDTDALILGAGITTDMIHVRSNENGDLVLSFDGTDDTVTIRAMMYQGWGVEEVHFQSGEVWTASDLRIKARIATEGDDVFSGSSESDTFSGLGGNDAIYADWGNDTVDGGSGNDEIYGSRGDDSLNGGAGDDDIDGGRGNDHLAGGHGADWMYDREGSDTYHFNLGDGADTIVEYDYEAYYNGYNSDTDAIVFGADIAVGDISARDDGDGNLIITIAGTSDSLTIEDFFDDLSNQVEELHFQDGTVLDVDDIMALASIPTAGDDVLNGTDAAETISGAGGADDIYGYRGNDVLNGDGGDDYISGGRGNDTYHGGTGDDSLDDYNSGSDIYTFNVGDGNDTVYDYDYYGFEYGFNEDTDVIVFGAGITAANVTVSANANGDLVLTYGATDSVTILGFVKELGLQIEEVHFADSTVWTAQQLLAMVQAATSGSDVISGSDGEDNLAGLGGADSIFGYDGDDTLAGGTADDDLVGGDGSDTYLFNLGGGMDTIREEDSYFYDSDYGYVGLDTDKIVFGAGISASNVTVASNGDGDLILHVGNLGDGLVIAGFFTEDEHRIEEVRFADGTTWNVDQLLAENLPTTNDDYLSGTSSGDTIAGLGGDDVIVGAYGDDDLTGGKGNDYLVGDQGSDTYRFNLGDGADTISEFDGAYYEYNHSVDTDVIVFGAGIDAANVSITVNSDGDLILSIDGTDDSILIEEFFSEPSRSIEEVRFQDGTVWDFDYIHENGNFDDYHYFEFGGDRGDTLTGSAKDEYIGGYGGNDVLAGSGGDDSLGGWEGSDTYIFNIGDGIDTIYEYDQQAYDYGVNEDNDVIVLGNGITEAMVRVRQDDSGSLILTIGTNGDRIVIDQYRDGLENQIEEVRFQSGAVWTANDLEDKAHNALLNSAPTDLTLTGATVVENAAVNTVVGTLSGVDPDEDDLLAFSLLDDADGRFKIVDGKIVVANSANLNFEANATHTLTVVATDISGATYQEQVVINVTNVNEAPADISLSSTTIDENAAANTIIGTLTGTDPDSGTTLSYSLIDSFNGTFAISNGHVVLAAGASLDFETKSSYTITVRASDGTLTRDEQFTITVNDVNEAPTDIGLTPLTIAENSAAGTVIGALSALDPDATDTKTYTLTGSANGLFSLVNGQIVLAAGASLDFETQSTYTITVQVTDKGNLTRQEDFTISVTNLNEAPTDISLVASPVSELAAAGAVVGTLSATDLDSGDTKTLSLVDDAGGHFALNSNGQIVIASGTHLDFETAQSHQITVRVTDALGLFYEEDFQINVTNVTETIKGGNGVDALAGFQFEDILQGLNGNDTLDGGDGADRLDGGKGTDTASYMSALEGVTANLLKASLNAGDALGDTYVAIENLLGSDFADILIGNKAANKLDGALGDDLLTGGAGKDMFVFGLGYGIDTITDFAFKGKTQDRIDLSDALGIDNYKDMLQNHVTVADGDIIITADDGAQLIIEDTQTKYLGKGDFIF